MRISATSPARRSARGFMLLEVMLSLAIFALMATAFSRALSVMSRTNAFMREELVITQILDSALNEALYRPSMEEGTFEVFVEERDVDVETQIFPLELENEEGVLLQQMWEVKIIARYSQNGIDEERSVRGWRYLPLYKP